MTSIFRVATLTFAGLLLAALPAAAAPIDDCAALAASPFEAGYKTIGKEQAAINTEDAIATCTAAIGEDDAHRVEAWLARAYYTAGSYDEAYRFAAIAADAGNAVGLHLVGVLLSFGSGVEADPERGIAMLQQAADTGYIPAISALAYNHLNGLGTTADPAKAADLYRVAAEGGFTSAATQLGFLYEEGKGVAQDYTEARKWFELAAAGNDARGLHELGWFYEQSLGVDKDEARAADYYRQAIAAGFNKSRVNLAILYIEGGGVERDMVEARALLEEAAKNGNTDATALLEQFDKL